MNFQNMNFLDDFNSNLKPFFDKMDNGELTLEDILNEDNIIQDIKSNNDSKFINFFNNEKIQKLIDYSTKFPSSDDHNIGYKYPFNSTEILCSDNTNFQKILLAEKPFKSGEKLGNKEILKRVIKSGFFTKIYNVINNNKIGDKKENENEDEENGDKSEDSDESEEENNDEKNNEEGNKGEKTNKKNEIKFIYENLDYLLTFLKESDRTKENYVLVGYFYKILNSLINIHQMKIIDYLLDYPKKEENDILSLLIKHMNRKSMSNIVQKLLIFDEEMMSKYDDKKLELLSKIFVELDITDEKNKYDCICDCICSIINNRQFFDLFMTKKELLEKIYNILFDCKINDKYNSLLKLLIKINENILQHFPVHYTETNNENNNDMMNINNDNACSLDKSVSSPDDNLDTLKNYLLTLFNILEKNQFSFLDDFKSNENYEFTATYMEKQKKIGIKKILETEYLKTLVDVLVNSYASRYHDDNIEQLIKICNEKNIFWNLHDLFFNFPFSNIFQIYYNQIVKIVLNENSPNSLIDAFLTEGMGSKRNLIELYIDKVFSDMKFIFKLTNTQSLNPIFSYMITILNKIFTCQNLYVKSTIEKSKDLSVFHEVLVQEIDSIFNQKLLLSDNSNFGGFGFDNIEEETPLKTFGPKNFMEIIEENCRIYEMYKKGEDYQKALKEKKERAEKEKKHSRKDSKLDKKGVEYIDDFEEDDDPLFKVEKINLKQEKENFLAMLNKPTEEVNIEEDNKDVIIDNIENDGDFKTEHIGRFKELWDDEDEKDKEKNEEKEKDANDNNNENNNENPENNENKNEEKKE